MAGLLVLLLSAIFIKGGVYASLQITLKESVVKAGDPIEFLCHARGEVAFCRMVFPNKSFIVKENQVLPDRSYFGGGLKAGDCGVRINAATEDMNGEIQCAVTLATEDQEIVGKANLTFAKTPSKPELSVSPPERGNEYKENEKLFAKCVVKNGRPAANITWYIGDEKITEGLSLPLQEGLSPPVDLYTIQQNLTRRVQASDNGKELKCVAAHPLLDERLNTKSKMIKVIYPPKEMSLPLERFNLVEGEEVQITVTVLANPKPTFTWVIGEESLSEGQQDQSGRFMARHGVATPSQDMLQGSWDSVLVINPLKSEDVEKTYELLAKNPLGQYTYKVLIYTSPEPKMLELGVGAIVGIVVAVLVILTIAALLLFARAKGRWCFAGGAGMDDMDTQDEEKHQPDGNDNPAANHNAQFISDSPDLKKVKEDTPV